MFDDERKGNEGTENRSDPAFFKWIKDAAKRFGGDGDQDHAWEIMDGERPAFL